MYIDGAWGYLVGTLLIMAWGGGSIVICATLAEKIEIWAKKRHTRRREKWQDKV